MQDYISNLKLFYMYYRTCLVIYLELFTNNIGQQSIIVNISSIYNERNLFISSNSFLNPPSHNLFEPCLVLYASHLR